ncbi:MAG: riboflavin synthase [Lactobacillus sp.]|jgi:riboflavin synthase|nr:riboflavin synthase [Lactobacillus sp.]
MFTGIIQSIGTVAHISQHQDTAQLQIKTPLTQQLHSPVGASIAVNGVCLTITALKPDGFETETMPETMARTNLGRLRQNAAVNLEPALQANGRLDGHFVQGHVDTTATLITKTAIQNAQVLTFDIAPAFAPYIVEKGSIAIDGVSLTLTAANRTTFSVSLIPHTLEATILGQLQPGDLVNIETDILGKYLQRQQEVFANASN